MTERIQELINMIPEKIPNFMPSDYGLKKLSTYIEKTRDHPLYPLLQKLIDKTVAYRSILTTSDPRKLFNFLSQQETPSHFSHEIQEFVKKNEHEFTPLFTADKEVNTIVLYCIKILYVYIIDLHKCCTLSHTFVHNYSDVLIQNRQPSDANETPNELNGKINNVNSEFTLERLNKVPHNDVADKGKQLSAKNNIIFESNPKMNGRIRFPEKGIYFPEYPVKPEDPHFHKPPLPMPQDPQARNWAFSNSEKPYIAPPLQVPNGTHNTPRFTKRSNLPRPAVDILKSWLFQHLVHPYPTEEEKRLLAQQTNLNLTQVNNWFINARRRILQPMLEPRSQGNIPTIQQAALQPHTGLQPQQILQPQVNPMQQQNGNGKYPIFTITSAPLMPLGQDQGICNNTDFLVQTGQVLAQSAAFSNSGVSNTAQLVTTMGGVPTTQPIVMRAPNDAIFATQPQSISGQTGQTFLSQDPNRPGTYTVTQQAGVNVFSPPMPKIKNEMDTDNSCPQMMMSDEQQQLTIVTTPQIIPPNNTIAQGFQTPRVLLAPVPQTTSP